MTKAITHTEEIAEKIKEIFPDIIEYHQLRDSVLIRIKHTDGKKYTINIHPEQRRRKVQVWEMKSALKTPDTTAEVE